MKRKWYQYIAVLLICIFALTGCGSLQEKEKENQDSAPEIAGLTYEKTMDLTYAEEFDVYYYKDGYKLINIQESGKYLIVPEGKEAPEGLDEDIKIIQQPLQHVYMAASASMSLIASIDAVDCVKFSGLDESDWYVDAARQAMQDGNMIYAGKYSEPDYENLVDGDCDLAIESTMILHTPKVQEMIEDLDIPVLIDYASYESHPLGRTEWVKLYGALFNKETEAEKFFSEQAKIIEDLEGFENTEKTVAYFYINTGGRYAFSDLKNSDNNAPSVKLTMEEFYATAVDADYLIYNGTIVGQVSSIKELEAKNNLFSEFKAVKNGNVWYTGKNLYQSTDTVGELIRDIHLMLTEENPQNMTFLQKME